MSARLTTRWVPLGVSAEPSWKLELAPASWRLDDREEFPRSALLLDPSMATPEVPLAPRGPMLPPPARLSPISDLGVATGVAMPWMRWTTINDRSGHFRERFAPGSFRETLQNRDTPIVSLFSHGHDPAAGYKSLGPLSLWEADDGLRYDLAFLDAPYVRDVAEGVRHNLYGMSVRFATNSERAVRRPARSQNNPLGLEERTITAARLIELSVTALPAYGGTSATIAA